MTGRAPLRTVRPVGDRALLAECAGMAEVLALHRSLLSDPLTGQSDLLAAATTVLVVLDAPEHQAMAATRLARRPAGPAAGPGSGGPGTDVVVETVYDGADLEEVGELTGLGADGVVAVHTGRTWVGAFGGFAPGFVYLVPDETEGDAPGGAALPPLDVARLAVPRTRVPPGAVALGGPYSAVYPRPSPGGWRLVGRTEAVLWDLDRDPPALVRPGDRVRFVAVRPTVRGGASARVPGVPSEPADPKPPSRWSPSPPTAPSPSEALVARDATSARNRVPQGGLTVVDPGLQSLVQDCGRPGLLDLGVSPSGAVDRAAATRANRLLGNARDAAVIETVLGGLSVRAEEDLVVAVTGAEVTLTLTGPAHEDGGAAWSVGRPTDRPLRLPWGANLTIGAPRWGMRSYLAVRGGIDVAPVLGSRSTDLLSGLGPAPLTAGDRLGVLPPPRESVALPGTWPPPARTVGPVTVDVVPGPRDDWFRGSAAALAGRRWTVTDRSNRVGLRLDGPPLERVVATELPSEGVVAGAVQVPPSGLPVVFLADHPVSGGYPVVAVVVDEHRDRLAQLRPGDALVLRPTTGTRSDG